MLKEILGNWETNSLKKNDDYFYLNISAEKRIIQFVLVNDKRKKIPMKLWYEELNSNLIEVRAKLGGKSWICKLILSKNGILHLYNNNKLFKFKKMNSTSFPHWYENELNKQTNEMMIAEGEFS